MTATGSQSQPAPTDGIGRDELLAAVTGGAVTVGERAARGEFVASVTGVLTTGRAG